VGVLELPDSTILHSMISYWHNPDVCPFVTPCIVALRVGVQG